MRLQLCAGLDSTRYTYTCTIASLFSLDTTSLLTATSRRVQTINNTIPYTEITRTTELSVYTRITGVSPNYVFIPEFRTFTVYYLSYVLFYVIPQYVKYTF